MMADALLGGIVINEVLVDPDSATTGFDTDGNGTPAATDEFVEIVNVSAAAIEISGLQVWDAANGNWFTFPPGTVLEPGAHALIVTGVQSGGALPVSGPDDLGFDAGRGTAVLNNGGDNIVLYDPASDTFIQATYNGDALDDPANDYGGFSTTATRIGSGEDFGTDVDAFSIQRTPDGADAFANDQPPTPAADNICFGAGTLIATETGARPAECLQVGDKVITEDNGPSPVKWIGRRSVGSSELILTPDLRPIRIRARALGPGVPIRDLVVSPQHRIVANGKIVERMFDCPEVLAPAKHLIALEGIDIAWDLAAITYFHVMLDRHEILFAEDVPTESLYAGDQALRGIDQAGLMELFSIFPELRNRPSGNEPMPVRRLLRGREARSLIKRHIKNKRPLVGAVRNAAG